MTSQILFFDCEVDPRTEGILDIGAVAPDGTVFHGRAPAAFEEFTRSSGARFVCGHNILRHDLKYLGKHVEAAGVAGENVIDTLFLSPLLFPKRPYHRLVKDDRLHSEELSNPVNDSLKAKDLFFDEFAAWQGLEPDIRQIFARLLRPLPEFAGFISVAQSEPVSKISVAQVFEGRVCANAPLDALENDAPAELAYALALINAADPYSIPPPWILHEYPGFNSVFRSIANTPCRTGCAYCKRYLDAGALLKKFFGFDSFRTYAGEPLQEMAASAALSGESLLAVFPTGGGKSLTFQLPALAAGENEHSLTVIISPLQSLMKDQVDNLEKQGISSAVAINGLLDPIERAKAMESVEQGTACILYIAPESLRSKTIERLLLSRTIARFVIDEAHCFSSWGQDFRPDYLFIADFIKKLQADKELAHPIPVSCFTATAKQRVIEDIIEHFHAKLGLNLKVFASNAGRDNLRYDVAEYRGDTEKYAALRAIIEEKPGRSVIVYVSRTKRAEAIARQLCEDGYLARPYHGKMDIEEKTANQDAFMRDEIDVIVATSAFGMGVDKKDVELVVHFEIADSLENYVQEAGRAGRDASMHAECRILFDEDDLDKHFLLLNQTKLGIAEIKAVWRAVKSLTSRRRQTQNSPLEIAREAGWDDTRSEMETRVITAINALELSGYLKRGMNSPRIYANSILCRSMTDASHKIAASTKFTDEKQRVSASRILQRLFSARSRKADGAEGEERVDYLADSLGVVREEVVQVINILREEGILGDHKDLTAHFKGEASERRALGLLASFLNTEQFILSQITDSEYQNIHVKALHDLALERNCPDATPERIVTILNYWETKRLVLRRKTGRNHYGIKPTAALEVIRERLTSRKWLCEFLLKTLYSKAQDDGGRLSVEFSVLELRAAALREAASLLLKPRKQVSQPDIEDTLFYLSKIGAIKIDGGFMVCYNALTIERLQDDLRIQYKKEDYSQLAEHYAHKAQQIHIVGEYARKMMADYTDALQFVDDYFHLGFPFFLNKYFPDKIRQRELRKTITAAKSQQLFGDLSDAQRRVIDDSESPVLVVAAGPGSGKTKVLAHKLAALLILEDVKHEQLLMLTFSRAAATEFKRRLMELVGNAAGFVEISTFHSYAFELLGRVGNEKDSERVVQEAVEKIQSGNIEKARVAKSVLVIDEAQDLSAPEYELIKALHIINDGALRIIAVGDDDQNIYGFRGSSSEYLREMLRWDGARKYELVTNFRAKANLVTFANQIAVTIPSRIKSLPVTSYSGQNGAIRITSHPLNTNMIRPVVEDVAATAGIGTSCVLTFKNDDAADIAGLLNARGIPARLIQSNDDFNLMKVREIRWFLRRFSDAAITAGKKEWELAKRELAKTFEPGRGLEACQRLVSAFEMTNPKTRYISDFKLFVHESKMEDFSGEASGSVVTVSTMHKAKGREFDQVYLMLNSFDATPDDNKRLLYVAVTRARTQLAIHHNTNLFRKINAEALKHFNDSTDYGDLANLYSFFGHKDIHLDKFKWRQRHIRSLKPDEVLTPNGVALHNPEGQGVLTFSKAGLERIAAMRQRGYELKEASPDIFLWWQGENDAEESLIFLPRLLFTRNS